jgi:bifunctional DNA-binding transcriptional regulator/antitoxin component of YhaV-PrlF toxin-antitoxin module
MAPIAHSKLTAQGQVSVPAVVRRRLGVGPGAVLEWDEERGAIVVRRAGRYSSEDVHRTVLPGGAPKRRPLAQIKEGKGRYARARHARG